MGRKCHKIIVELDRLPKLSNGFINWVGSVGSVVPYLIDGTEYAGHIRILDMRQPNRVTISVDDGEPGTVTTTTLVNGYICNFVGARACIFEFNIGEEIICPNQSIVILEQILIHQNTGYRVKCLRDGYEYEITQSDLKQALKLGHTRCPVCGSLVIVDGVNSLFDVSPDLAVWFADKEIPHKIPRLSNKKYDLVCPICNTHFQMSPQSIRTIPNCPHCGDGFSFPEKVFLNLLHQLGISFITQLSRKHFEWCGKYRFDFYFVLNGQQYIVELDGGLGHGKVELRRTNSKERDETKDRLAEENGITMIRIDVDYNDTETRFEYIVNNICNSEIAALFDLNNVDWDAIKLRANKSVLQICCDEYNSGNTYLSSIAEKYHISKDTVRRYLKIAREYNLCSYDSSEGWKEYMRNHYPGSPSRKYVKITHGGKSIICRGVINAPDAIMDAFGIKITKKQISRHLANPSMKSRKGLDVSYATEQDYSKNLQCLS